MRKLILTQLIFYLDCVNLNLRIIILPYRRFKSITAYQLNKSHRAIKLCVKIISTQLIFYLDCVKFLFTHNLIAHNLLN